MEQIIVYSGPAYGRLHDVLRVYGRTLLVRPVGGLKSFWVNICDTDTIL